ncbi:YhjD/YihY/BrkB family envelope integrity protein [Tsukamurella sp. 8F]|uniref:YhjD/YihY/BrkB family envelope integrity protein n=1 Tax=unclassified Tsukamurella TaxID=2633480 RepID=UPI0023BA2E2D|nr:MULTISPECIES: YhjD/YihY/BrkB family envelope integrity protein [unclassified Tsukamurella]MDF0531835.1 YhjD/YihY/BrkB family envelope integrity protein [Tsukamurella sp. 8J]MDF0589087.1 YhjD/YihY/BrkB family envelope integrity protein [Tsukamurella sp. 8F]
MAQTQSEIEQAENPGLLDRYRAKWPWFDHVMAAATRYKTNNGDYFGAGITYFSVFALFPLLMLAFSVMGFLLIGQPEILDEVRDKITSSVSGDMADKLKKLVDQAIDARATVGVIGLVGGLWAGLGWVANVRAALTEMWDSEVPDQNFVRGKLADLVALIGLGIAMVLFGAITALGSSPLTRTLLDKAGLGSAPGLSLLIRAVTFLITMAGAWLLFTYVISRLPRVQFPWRNAVRAGLLTAVVFVIFIQVATLIIGSTMKGPAGQTFGPILGIMLFIYFTSRIVLFATAWAATDPRNQQFAVPKAPDPVVISPMVREEDGSRSVLAGAAGFAAGAGAALLLRRKR